MNKLYKTLFIFLFPVCVTAQDVINFDSEPENLGPNVNSEYDDLLPLISPDGKTIFICRYPSDNNKRSNIWYSTLQTNGTWSKSKNIGTPLNVKGSSTAVGSITPDGNSILLSNIYRYFDGSVKGGGCSISFRQRGGWSFPKQQNIEKFENLNQYVNFFLTNDGKTLLMAIETKWKGHQGQKDIYVSFRTGDNEWSKPKNLGNVINTKGGEFGMFVASDGETMYYSSDGLAGGYGMADIWMTRRLDDTWLKWSKPVNLGPKINSSNFDSYFTIPASGDYAYYSSAKSGYGISDIFRIKLPGTVKPNPVVLVYGKVLNAKTKEPVMTEIKYEFLPDGSEAGIARSEPVMGEYKIVLPYGKNYGYRAVAQGFYAVSENLDVTDLKEYKEIERNLYLAPIEVNEVVRLNNIFFEFGKARLKSESFSELSRVVKLMSENPSIEIEISGHTDNVGADADNLNLSQERAQAVVEYLSQNGVKLGRMGAKGYGETIPVGSNDTDEGRQFNRRVEFKILKK